MKYSPFFFLFTLILYPPLYAHKKKLVINEQPEDISIAIPLTEDLMREHGVLNRILLIYEEIIRRIQNDIEFPVSVLKHTADITKNFIENYHEKLEENHIFPLFEKHNKKTRLINILKEQHNKGRKITTEIQKLSSGSLLTLKQKKRIRSLLRKYIKMDRPHEAREETVLFPRVRSLINNQEFMQLSKVGENLEEKMFGKNGFRNIIRKVENIEQNLGIYALEQFTPTKTK